MKRKKKQKLESSGWRIGNSKEFLGLTDEEAALVEIKRALVKQLAETRKANKITQTRLAKMINSSQSRIAKMESGSPDVTLDLLVKALFALGATRKQVARAIEKA
jgi:predicted transcriptional regulator